MSLMRSVHHEFFVAPSYDEFKPKTLWSLENSFTSIFKKLKPVAQFEATAKLGKFLAAYNQEVFGNFYVCALGAAVVGKFGSARKAYKRVEAEREVHVELESRELALLPGYVDIAANLLDIDFDLAEAIDKTHMLGVSAMAITQRLGEGTFPY